MKASYFSRNELISRTVSISGQEGVINGQTTYMCENQQHLSTNLLANPLFDLSQVKSIVILRLGP